MASRGGTPTGQTAQPIGQAMSSPTFQQTAQQLGYQPGVGSDGHPLMTPAQYLDVLYHIDPNNPAVQQAVSQGGVNVSGGHVQATSSIWEGAGAWAIPLVAFAIAATAGALLPALTGGSGVAGAAAADTAVPTTLGIDAGTAAALPGATAVGAGAGGAAAAGGLAATSTVPATGALAPAVAPSGLVSGGLATGGSTLSTIGNALRDPSTLSAAGKAISAATTASQSNQRQDAGITQNAYVQDSQLETQQRREALRNIYAQGVVSSGQHGPYDPTPPIPSAAYIAALNNLQQQGSQRLGQPAQYATTNFPNPNSYTNPTTLQTAGTYLGPALQIAGTFLGR